jgi:dienelactone hydrolase
MSWLKWCFATKWGCLSTLLMTGMAITVFFAFWLAPSGLGYSGDPEAYFAKRQGNLVEASQDQPAVTDEHYEVHYHRLTSSSGLAFDLSVKAPRHAAPTPRPLIVMLGGFNEGRNAIRFVGEPGEVVVAALSYPYAGDRRPRGLAWLPALRGLRRALHDMPPAISLALDFLTQRDDVDPHRIELVGVSLGSVFAIIAGARDDRVDRVWAVHGGADTERLFHQTLQKHFPAEITRDPLVGLGQLLVGRLTPEHWVDDLAPRPFIMINAEHDERIPRECVDLLYAAAGEPKQLIWLPTRHVDPDREEIVQQLVAMVTERILREPVPSLD